MLALLLLTTLVLAMSLCAAQPLTLSGGPHLFLDDHLIAEQTNLTRVVNHPERFPEPVVTGPEDKCFQPYLTVLRDPDTGRFRIWYGVPESAGQSHVAYMESADGIHWERPHRVLDDPTPIQFGVSILDEGPAIADPSARFKYGYWHDGGLKIAASPDGLAWTPLAPGVVLPHNHDINSIFRDPLRDRYIAFVSSYTEGPTWTGQRRIPMCSVSDDLIHWREPWVIFAPDEQDEGETQFYCMDGVIARGDLLIGLLKVLRDDLPADPGGPVAGIGYTVLAWSRDGEHWTRDREPFMDRGPAGTWDHAMTWGDEQLIVRDDTFIYYGGYRQGHKTERFTERQIGLARMKRDRYVSLSAGKQRGFLRTPPLAFASPSLGPPASSPASPSTGPPAPLPASPSTGPPAPLPASASTGAPAPLPASPSTGAPAPLPASPSTGPPASSPASPLTAVKMTINARAAGELCVRILDPEGKSLPGLDWLDCKPIRGDGVDLPMEWSASLAELREQPFCLEFALRDADLYGFSFAAP